jgi:hypothetical protein
MAPNVFTPPPELPHREISIEVILIVEEALRVAWELLINEPPNGFNLATAHEDIVTEKFLFTLVNRVLKSGNVPGFTKALFCVSREEKHPNYNGQKPDKMPDLAVHIINRPDVLLPTEDRLFIECKPVDRAHPAGRDYCGEGLLRFVQGDYAWTMHQGMMIGYARSGYTVIPKLHDALMKRASPNSPQKIKTLQYPLPCLNPESQSRQWCETIHITCHERSFPYNETGQPAPPITLRHLWLRRD